jgi:hypothetical protein
MVNPYANRTAIRNSGEFFGRTRELSQIYSLTSQGHSVFLTGERRVGKSSILNAIAFRFDCERISQEVPPDLCFVFIDSQLFENASEKDFLKFLLNRITTSVGTPVLEPHRISLFRVAEELASRPERKRLGILLDEVDVLVQNPNIPGDLFSFLRAWVQRFQIPLVTASREGSIEPLLATDGPGSPFWNIFNNVYVGPLQEQEAMELISTPAEQFRHPFTPGEINQILHLGGYHPFFLQLACYHMFNLKTERAEPSPEFATLELEFRSEAWPHMSYLLERLTEAEKRALRSYVVSGSLPDEMVRAHLLKKGIMVKGSEGLRLFSSTFGDLIRAAEDPTSAKASNLQRILGNLLK